MRNRKYGVLPVIDRTVNNFQLIVYGWICRNRICRVNFCEGITDIALKIYRRKLKLHYSVFDVSGKQVYGDVAVVDFPSNSNDIAEIMQQNFPKIGESIVQHLPRKKAPVALSLTEAKESR